MHNKNQQIKLIIIILFFFALLVMLPASEAATLTLYPNSAGTVGWRAQATNEALYARNFPMSASGTMNSVNASGLSYMSTNDSQYEQQAGTSTLDEYILVNFSKENVLAVQWINVTATVNGTASGEYIYIGLFNGTAWGTKNSTDPTVNNFKTITLNDSNSANWTLVNNVLIFKFMAWSSGGSNGKVLVDYIRADITYTPATYIPPTPTSLANTTGYYWVNHTWSAGSGNVTNLYNVSVNGTWNNGSATKFYNNTNVGISGWSNISVWAYNSTNGGTLSLTNASQNTQAPGAPDTSFTVTLPVGYSQGFFNASLKTQNNVNASGQTLSAGFLNITNTGTKTENFLINVTSASPSGATLKAKTDNNPTGATTITTTLAQIITGLGIGASQYVWLWVDYSNAAQMNVQRTMTINSS